MRTAARREFTLPRSWISRQHRNLRSFVYPEALFPVELSRSLNVISVLVILYRSRQNMAVFLSTLAILFLKSCLINNPDIPIAVHFQVKRVIYFLWV